MADEQEADVEAASPQPQANDSDIEKSGDVQEEEVTKHSPTAVGTPNLDGANDPADIKPKSDSATATVEAVTQPEEIEARIPAKKDATLREFLGKMDDYAPIVRQTPTPSPLNQMVNPTFF